MNTDIETLANGHKTHALLHSNLSITSFECITYRTCLMFIIYTLF